VRIRRLGEAVSGSAAGHVIDGGDVVAIFNCPLLLLLLLLKSGGYCCWLFLFDSPHIEGHHFAGR
jgi:hypothetical protein